MNIDQIHRFLAGIHHKIDEQKKIAQITGENFNVFRIVGMETSEVHTHSAFLGELLNPKGAHGQGSIFLKLFLAAPVKSIDEKASTAQLIRDFHAETARLELEVYIGQIDAEYTEGGRIDIVLTDQRGRHIFIENKINARDQKNQMLRYNRHDPKAALFYLTLSGESPSKDSLGNGGFEVHAISYQKDILQWLIQCRKESAMLPSVREALTQYVELIRFLTNQTAMKTMKEEIKALILKSPDFIEAIDACSQSLTEIVWEADKNFREVMGTKWADQIQPIHIDGKVVILAGFAEDADGFYVGYRFMDGDKNISSTDQGIKYANHLRAIDPTFVRNSGNIGWHNPVGFSRRVKVANLDKRLLLKFYLREKELDEFARKIISQQIQIRNDLEKMISNSATHQPDSTNPCNPPALST